MSGYGGADPGVGAPQRFTFIATQGQTTFSGADSRGYTLNYKAPFVEVVVDGDWLTPDEYTAIDGSTIVMQGGCVADQKVYVFAFNTYSPADAVALNGNNVPDIKTLLANLNIWETGDAKITMRQTAGPGWIKLDDGSIGSASSNATTRANTDTADLFSVLYALPIGLTLQDAGGSTVARGASAAADYAANRRLVVPKALGRSIAIAGTGAGLTARALGSNAGAETETPTIAKTASHDHAQQTITATPGLQQSNVGPGNSWFIADPSEAGARATALKGGGQALNILDPSVYFNVFMKL